MTEPATTASSDTNSSAKAKEEAGSNTSRSGSQKAGTGGTKKGKTFNNGNHKTPNTTTISFTGVTPSHVAKTKLNDLYGTLPDEDLAVVTRTYTSRLHQVRLQREHRRQTYERLTSSSSPDNIPASCQFRFELGASSPAVTALPAYVELKTQVENSIRTCQTTLAQSIAQLQLLEMQVKQEEIAKIFCEGLSRIAVALINYHRDLDATKIAKTMQSQRLADRLVELVLEDEMVAPRLLEHSWLVPTVVESNNNDKGTNNNGNKTDTNQKTAATAREAYYRNIGRDMPTHSRQQNRNQKSSPYNDYHTEFLKDILPEFLGIIEPCFHTSWNDYIQARHHLHNNNQQQQQHHDLQNKKPVSDAHNNRQTKQGDTKCTKKDANETTTAAPPAQKQQEQVLTSKEALKEMVQAAVSEETQALRETIRHLEEQVAKNTNTNNKAATSEVSQDSGNTATANNNNNNNNNKGGRNTNKNKINTTKVNPTKDNNENGKDSHASSNQPTAPPPKADEGNADGTLNTNDSQQGNEGTNPNSTDNDKKGRKRNRGRKNKKATNKPAATDDQSKPNDEAAPDINTNDAPAAKDSNSLQKEAATSNNAGRNGGDSNTDAKDGADNNIDSKNDADIKADRDGQPRSRNRRRDRGKGKNAAAGAGAGALEITNEATQVSASNNSMDEGTNGNKADTKQNETKANQKNGRNGSKAKPGGGGGGGGRATNPLPADGTRDNTLFHSYNSTGDNKWGSL